MRLFTNYSFLAISILIISCNNVYSATCKATQNGDWEDGSTWDCGHQPTNGDVVIIPTGKTVSVTTNVKPSPLDKLQIYMQGVLNFDTGKLNLAAGSGITIETGAQLKKTGSGGGTSSVINIGGTTVWSAADGNVSGPFSFGSPIPLPIRLIEFNASYNETHSLVEITWQTATEINNSHFDVERSYDGKNFENIKRINGNNNSNTIIKYEYYDDTYTKHSVTYYRLKQVDNNGQFTYSKVEAVKASITLGLDISVYPNPVSGNSFTIAIQNTYDDIESVSVCDNYGKVLYTKKLEDSQRSFILSGENIGTVLVPGIYTIFAVSNDKIVHERLLIQ